MLLVGFAALCAVVNRYMGPGPGHDNPIVAIGLRKLALTKWYPICAAALSDLVVETCHEFRLRVSGNLLGSFGRQMGMVGFGLGGMGSEPLCCQRVRCLL